jgi:hypothetical protein
MQIPTGIASNDAPPAEWTNVETFALDPAKLVPWLFIVAALNVGMSIFVFGAMLAVTALGGGKTWADILGSAICLAVGFAIYTAITLPMALLRARRSWKVCQLVLADEGLLLTQLKARPKRVNREDVVSITDTYDTLRLHLARGRIDVSKRLLTPDRIRSRLAAWQPIQPGKGLLGVGALTLFTLVSTVAFAVLYALGLETTSKTTLILCIVGTLAHCLIQIALIFRNRGSRLSTRITALIILLGPLHLLYLLLFRR